MINKTKTKTIDWFLHFFLILLIIESISSNVIPIPESNISSKTNSNSLPKVITLQTYKDWSSRLGAANDTTPQSSALVFQESKEVKTTDYSLNQNPLITQNTINWLKDLNIKPKTENINKTNEVNAHTIAAQVLSRLVHISPLLALASNGVPSRRYNMTSNSVKRNNRFLEKMPSIDALNEIDTESNGQQFKSDRKSASGISFPTLPTTTTDNTTPQLFETTPTEATVDLPDYPQSQTDEDEGEDQRNDRSQDQSEDEEPAPPEDPDEYDDDEELESFTYPVITDSDEDNTHESDNSPHFVIPNIHINPESLKQKGCRTVVKEVQAIPINGKGVQNNNQNPNPMNTIKRNKRNADPNARKFTSIVMTKECHFPGDEGASSEQNLQTVPTTIMSESTPESVYQTPNQEYFEEYDEDFDFRPQLSYRPSDSADKMETKSSNDRKSYADNPIFRRDNSEFMPLKEEFDFDAINADFFERPKNLGKKKPNSQNSAQKRNNRNRHMSASPSGEDYDNFDDEGFGAPPKKRQNQNQRSRQKKPPVYRGEGNGRRRGGGGGRGGGGKKKKPKKVNRSFAFFRKAEPKDKKPNESDYSVSYGRGNFQSFSDSYDSDRDGPRKKGQKRPADSEYDR